MVVESADRVRSKLLRSPPVPSQTTRRPKAPLGFWVGLLHRRIEREFEVFVLLLRVLDRRREGRRSRLHAGRRLGGRRRQRRRLGNDGFGPIVRERRRRDRRRVVFRLGGCRSGLRRVRLRRHLAREPIPDRLHPRLEDGDELFERQVIVHELVRSRHAELFLRGPRFVGLVGQLGETRVVDLGTQLDRDVHMPRRARDRAPELQMGQDGRQPVHDRQELVHQPCDHDLARLVLRVLPVEVIEEELREALGVAVDRERVGVEGEIELLRRLVAALDDFFDVLGLHAWRSLARGLGRGAGEIGTDDLSHVRAFLEPEHALLGRESLVQVRERHVRELVLAHQVDARRDHLQRAMLLEVFARLTGELVVRCFGVFVNERVDHVASSMTGATCRSNLR